MFKKITFVALFVTTACTTMVSASLDNLVWKVEEGLHLKGGTEYYNQEGILVDLSLTALSKSGEDGLVTITIEPEKKDKTLQNYVKTFVVPSTGLDLVDYFFEIDDEYPNFKVNIDYVTEGGEKYHEEITTK